MGCVCSICFHHSSAGHDGTALWAIIGSVSNLALSVFLKRLLNQARPATISRTDPGMPSSHAQSISFISVFAVLSVMEWLGTNEVSLFLIMLILALGSYFMRLRVSQKLHTSNQVVVGGFVGSVFCIFWYKTWNLLLLEAFKSSLLLQIYVFLVASAYTLAFAAHVVLTRSDTIDEHNLFNFPYHCLKYLSNHKVVYQSFKCRQAKHLRLES